MNVASFETYALAGIGAIGGVYKYYVRPEITATRGWMAIGALVAFHEVACLDGELLSQGFDRALEKHKVLTVLGTLTITGHLLNIFPADKDPIHWLTMIGKS